MWDIFTELVLRLGNNIMGIVIGLEIVLKLVGNVLAFCGKFVGSNSSLNKSS